MRKVNSEASIAIEAVLADIINEIRAAISNNTLTDEEKARLSNSLRALITNMKKNYGAVIKAYTQK